MIISIVKRDGYGNECGVSNELKWPDALALANTLNLTAAAGDTYFVQIYGEEE